jgi:hypothetical protein
MAVLGVVALFAAVLISGVVTDMNNVNHTTDIEAARAQALSGLADAMFRIDQEGAATSSFCVGTPATCTVSSIPGAPGSQYAARLNPNDPNTFTLESEGTVRGVSYAVQATVARIPTVPTAAFGASGITFNGSSGVTNVDATDQYGNVIVGGLAAVGSDGTITCHGSGSYGSGQITYDGGSSNCPNWTNASNAYTPQQPITSCPPPLPPSSPPTPCLPAGSNACPGTWNGSVYVVDGSVSPVTLEPGIYDCVGGLTLKGAVNVDYSSAVNNGKVELFVFPAAGGTAAPVDLSAGVLNQWETPPPASPAVVGDPTALQIYVGGSGNLTMNGAVGDAVLYAPGMSAGFHGRSSLNWIGALVVASMTVDGNPNFQLNYDIRTNTLVESNWQVSNFIQIAPSAFSMSIS